MARAAPDGYTFMITTMSTTVNNRIMYSKTLPYDPDKDLAPITQLSYGTVLFVGPGNAPYNDLKGFIAWAKGKDRVTYGSWGIASWGHLAGQILKREAGLNLEHVPYKGDVLAITDVQNGGLDSTFASPTSAKPRIASGGVKPIAMTGPQRSASMPELATFTEQGVPNVDLAIWVGAYAPAGTPRPIIDRLQTRAEGGDQPSRGEGEDGHAGPDPGGQHTGGVRRQRARRPAEMGRPDQGLGGNARVVDCAPCRPTTCNGSSSRSSTSAVASRASPARGGA